MTLAMMPDDIKAVVRVLGNSSRGLTERETLYETPLNCTSNVKDVLAYLVSKGRATGPDSTGRYHIRTEAA